MAYIPGGAAGPVAWTDITGKPSTFAPAAHTHPQSDVTSLVSDLAAKAAGTHSHAQADITGLVAALAGKSDTSHTHTGLARLVRITGDVGPVGNANTSVALSDVTGLSFSVAANTDYAFEFYILFQSTALTNGYQLALTCPAGATLSCEIDIPTGADGTAAAFVGYGTASADKVANLNVPAANVTHVARVSGILRNGANAGSLTVQHASELSTAGNNVTTKAGSAGLLFVLP